MYFLFCPKKKTETHPYSVSFFKKSLGKSCKCYFDSHLSVVFLITPTVHEPMRNCVAVAGNPSLNSDENMQLQCDLNTM